MIAFSLWYIHVYWYGIMYMLSFFFFFFILIFWQRKWWYSQYPLVNSLIAKDIDALILAILIGVIVGWRIGHVVIYDFFYFVYHPLKIFAIQEWGMSFIWWILGTILSVIIFLKISHQVFFSQSGENNILFSTLPLLDSFIPLVPVWIFFGRFGNFLNQELYGIIIPADFRGLPNIIIEFCQFSHLFHVYNHIGPQLRLNTNFLSMIFEGFFLSVVLWILFFKYFISKRRSSWQLSAVFLFWYSLIRFVLEFVRQDSQMEIIGLFSKSQYFFIMFMIFAILVFFMRMGKKTVLYK